MTPQNVWNEIALTLSGAEWDRAEALLRSPAAQNSAPAQAAYNLAKVLIEQDRSGEAEAHFRTAVDADPTYAAAWFELGRLHIDSGRLDDAHQAFRRVCEIDRDDADAWNNRLKLGERLGYWEDALLCVSHLRALGDDGWELHVWEARIQAERGNVEAARQGFARALGQKADKAAVVKAMTRTAKGRIPLKVSALLKEAC